MKAIACMANNGIIGKDGGIPWYCSDDLKWFKEFTLNQDIVVGRKTFEKLLMLKNRRIWVLSRSCKLETKNEPYQLIHDMNYIPKDAIIAGGAQIYDELLPYCEEFFVTKMKKDYEGDTWMPLFKHLFQREQVIRETEEFRLLHYTK